MVRTNGIAKRYVGHLVRIADILGKMGRKLY